MANPPDYIMAKLRGRRGLDKDDTSQDSAILAMSALHKFNEVCSWELGYSGWGETILGWARDCGLKKIPRDDD